MNIAMTAADSKKELLSRFCLAYKGVLKEHNLFCTAKTGKCIKDVTGLSVVRFLGGVQGGYKQIAAKVSCNEIDLVIYLLDPFIGGSEGVKSSKYELNRLCDIYSIPLATNFSTTEALILSLARGDLNWRIFVNPALNKKSM